MPHAKLSFCLPEEDPEFRMAYYGSELYGAITELDNDLRNWIKHGFPPDNFKTPQDVMAYVRVHFAEVLNKIQ